MNYMAMAGWKTSDMLDGIEGIMNLAAASGEADHPGCGSSWTCSYLCRKDHECGGFHHDDGTENRWCRKYGHRSNERHRCSDLRNQCCAEGYAVKYSAESTGTIAAANLSSGAVSAGWSQPGRNATQEPSMRRY